MTGLLAYLDAGTGSMIAGAVAAAGASVAVAARANWHRLTRRGKGSAAVEPETEQPVADADAVPTTEASDAVEATSALTPDA